MSLAPRLIAGLILAAAAGAVFGPRAAGLTAAVAAGLALTAWLQDASTEGPGGTTARLVLMAVETVLVCAAVLVAGPVAGGGVVPAPMLFFSPAVLALFCLLAAQAVGARPIASLWAGACAIAAWAGVRALALADPDTIVAAQVNPDDSPTLMDYLEAITRPHYQDDGLWQLQTAALGAFAVVLALAAWRARRLVRRATAAQAARDGLAAHFSAGVVETLLADRAARQGDVEAGVLDCDLTGYSAATAGQPPEAVAALLRAWHGLVEAQVFAQGGAVLKFTGDGVSAVFGLTGEADAAMRAAACARAVVAAWPPVAAGLGLASAPGVAIGLEVGAVRWGLVGEGRAASLVVLGEPVSSAARLQTRTRAAGAPILAGPAAARALGLANAPGLASEGEDFVRLQ